MEVLNFTTLRRGTGVLEIKAILKNEIKQEGRRNAII